MAHNAPPLIGWPPKKPKSLFARLLWWFDWYNAILAPHGNKCWICCEYHNHDDVEEV